MNDSERETGSPSPLEPLVRPEGTDSKRVPQDVKPEAILAMLRSEEEEWRETMRATGAGFAIGATYAFNKAIKLLREHMEANSEPPA